MTPRGWLTGAGAFGLLATACVGGQSGTEASSGGCDMEVSTVEAGAPTDNGTVEALAAAVQRPVSIPIRIHVAGGSDVDTTLTLTPSVNRSSGHAGVRSSSSGACVSFLTVRASLHFETGDGSFKDVFDGIIEKGGGQTTFSATLPLNDHVGNLDLTALAEKNSLNPILDVRTTLDAMPSGRLVLGGDYRDNAQTTQGTSASVADWP